jgi:hypothetical protein
VNSPQPGDPGMYLVTDKSVLSFIHSGQTWALIDDEYCIPPGELRKYVEDMIRRGLLQTDGERVWPTKSSATPIITG